MASDGFINDSLMWSVLKDGLRLSDCALVRTRNNRRHGPITGSINSIKAGSTRISIQLFCAAQYIYSLI